MPRLGLFDWLDRALARGFLQPVLADAVGVDLGRECARERGADGRHVALPPATRRFSFVVDAQLGRGDRHQHDQRTSAHISLFHSKTLDRYKTGRVSLV